MAAGPHIACPRRAGVERGAAAAIAAGVDQFTHRYLDAGMAQRTLHKRALEAGIGRWREVLQRAAAADAEIAAEWRDPVRAGLDDRDQRAALALGLDLRHFAGQGERDIDALAADLGDALAALAEP